MIRPCVVPTGAGTVPQFVRLQKDPVAPPDNGARTATVVGPT
jgi:hypothetical protein